MRGQKKLRSHLIPRRRARSASAIARSRCAEHVQQLGSESLPSNLMEVKD